MKFHSKSIAVAVASLAPLALVSTPAAAQPVPIDTIDQTDVIERINEETVAPALSVVTGNQIGGVDPQGKPTLIATATNGLRFEVNFRACEDGAEGEGRHCKAVYMISVWDAPVDGQAEELRTAMAAFALNNPAINAGQLGNGAPYVVRYVIADYGTKQGNLVSEFANFIRSATDFQNTISGFYPIAE
uniref:hypothetical protein n=1 Tax=uncultured Erythrobacter sp. TaxID=263913 RepID=UPI0026087443|nr:hypothetical protein [uncultured Erythrobacter sp.]